MNRIKTIQAIREATDCQLRNAVVAEAISEGDLDKAIEAVKSRKVFDYLRIKVTLDMVVPLSSNPISKISEFVKEEIEGHIIHIT